MSKNDISSMALPSSLQRLKLRLTAALYQLSNAGSSFQMEKLPRSDMAKTLQTLQRCSSGAQKPIDLVEKEELSKSFERRRFTWQEIVQLVKSVEYEKKYFTGFW